MKVAALVSLASVASAKVIFQETFDDTWKDRWIESTFKGNDQGEWKLSAGKYFADAEKDKGIQTAENSKFYGISAKFDQVSNKGKDLVIQFSVKHEQNIDCGGGYIKLFPSDLDQKKLHGESPYNIMFGPDICGSTKRVHVIFSYKGKNLLKNVDIPAKHDEFTHLYTLVVKPDNTYEVMIDMDKVASGKLEEDWDFLPPKEIDDPEATKPEDWDERAKIPDANDKKPEGWDDIPEFIADPEAKKPEDWDDEDDGEWEPPQISNPEYKGTWTPRMIDNPDYKGVWVKPKIPNPDYKDDSDIYLYEDIGNVGFDLWQVKAGSIFDNIIVADSLEDATKFAEKTFKVTVEAEKKAKEEADKKAEELRKAAEAEEAKKAEEEEDMDLVDDEDDEDVKEQEEPLKPLDVDVDMGEEIQEQEEVMEEKAEAKEKKEEAEKAEAKEKKEEAEKAEAKEEKEEAKDGKTEKEEAEEEKTKEKVEKAKEAKEGEKSDGEDLDKAEEVKDAKDERVAKDEL